MVESNVKIVFIGNPLLDLSFNDTEAKYMTKYDLKLGQAVLATPEQMPIYEEIFAEETCELVPGGSALNSARSAQHILKGSDNKVAYLGCIGKDAFGEKLTKCLDDQGVINKLA